MKNILQHDATPFLTITLASDLTITALSKIPQEYTQEQFEGKKIADFLSAEDQSNLNEALQQLEDSQETQNFIFRFPVDNFELHYFQGSLHTDESGYLVYALDIHPGHTKLLHQLNENKTLKARLEDIEEEVHIQQQNYEVFVENAPVGMFDIDMESRIITANKEAKRYFNPSSDEIRKHHFLEFVHESDLERLEECFNAASEGSEQYFSFQTNSEDFQILKGCFIPIKNYKGDTAKIFSVVEDITKEYLAEKILKEQNSTLEKKVLEKSEQNRIKDEILFKQSRHVQMGQLIKMIAHQWRQPLSLISTIAGNVEIMLELDNYQKEDLIEAINKIDYYAQSLSRIITDFNEFYKPSRLKSRVCLKDIGDSVISVMENSFKVDGIRFQRESLAQSSFYTYKNELTQVIINLLQNAQETLKERNVKDPCVHLKGYETDEYQIIEVEDNGQGIDETILPHIFDPYFSTKRSKNGSGLGLHMAKTMIENHCNGIIEVHNGSKGAKFTIKLPNSHNP